MQSGRVLLKLLNSVKRELSAAKLGKYVSKWFVDKLHELVYYNVLGGTTIAEVEGLVETLDSNVGLEALATKSEQLVQAIDICAPDMVSDGDKEDLADKVRRGIEPHPVVAFGRRIPSDKAILVCACPKHGKKRRTGCRVEQIESVLHDTAKDVWLCAQISFNAHLFRDATIVTYSGGTGVMLHVGDLPDQRTRKAHSLDTILTTVCSRLANRRLDHMDHRIACVAGGFAVGFLGNEETDISKDPGHSLYIYPGKFAVPERNIKNVVKQHASNPYLLPVTADIGDTIHLLGQDKDLFQGTKLRHELLVRSDTVYITSRLQRDRQLLLPLEPYLAIDLCHGMFAINGCLVDCVNRKPAELNLSELALCLPDGTHVVSLDDDLEYEYDPMEEEVSEPASPAISQNDSVEGKDVANRTMTDDADADMPDLEGSHEETYRALKSHDDLSEALEKPISGAVGGLQDAQSSKLSFDPDRLTIFPVRDNILWQRAVISNYSKVAIKRGGCIACAVVQAQTEDVKALLC